ncbi:alpha/beta hydrolase [Pedobacter jeongneungensis]|uniref:alpha/beta hydrolase n=1 Tax=Pedobacter jeongneungensis TaxID=947309 RepID=UPI0013B3EA29|nr:alpha/beta hydrolase [Pedobacter jeongneungensis]
MKIILMLILRLSFLQVSYAFTQPETKDILRLKYGSAAQHQLDLFLPATYTKNTAVIILLHGGAWMMGGNEYTDKTAKDLRNRGFIVANVDYRYVSENVNGQDLLSDIDHALAFIQRKSLEYHFRSKGYHLAGISAGAHLALLYGYTSSKNIRSITALCPPVRLDDPETMKALQKNNLVKNVELLAGAKYISNEKINVKFTEVSPYTYIKAIPTLLFHGDKDELVPDNQSKFLFKLLKEKKFAAKFVPMLGKGHDCGMNQPDSEKIVLDEIERWVKKFN